jgi:hypothetical protein
MGRDGPVREIPPVLGLDRFEQFQLDQINLPVERPIQRWPWDAWELGGQVERVCIPKKVIGRYP